RHRGRYVAACRAFERLFQIFERRRFDRTRGDAADGQISAQLAAPLVHVRHLGTVVGWLVQRRIARGLVGDRDLEARAEMFDLLLVELLLLVGDVAPFARFAQAVALDGL